MVNIKKNIYSVSVESISYLVIILLIVWLLFAALWVDIEYYDGLDTICNARFFLGKSDQYVGNRMPFMAFLIVPAEFIKMAFHLHPLDVRPHHLTMAFLHIAYLFFVYQWLKKKFEPTWSVFLAFFSSVPSFIFFSYSPFISHDIFPGMILMAMLLLSDSFWDSPKFKTWGLLVVCGVVAALIKQTYALFWIVVLISYMLVIVFRHNRPVKPQLYLLLMLFGGAACSGIITWGVLGYVLESVFPDKSLILRPYFQIDYVLHQYDEASVSPFPWWVYLRNMRAYGSILIIFIIPGLIMALREKRLHFTFALSWILSILIVHMLSMREVRYLAFLAPISAFLIVPPLRYLKKYPVVVIALLCLLIVDLSRISSEAARTFHPFYSKSMAKQFLQPIEKSSEKVIVNWPMLSFVSPIDSPLIGDRYHRLFHFGVHHLLNLYDVDSKNLVQVVPDFAVPDTSMQRNDGTIWIHANNLVVNNTAWTNHSKINSKALESFIAIDKSIVLHNRSKGEFKTQTGEIISIRKVVYQEKQVLAFEGDFLPNALRNCLLLYIQDASGKSGFNLSVLNQNQVLILGDVGECILQELILIVRAFEIKRLLKNGKIYNIGQKGLINSIE